MLTIDKQVIEISPPLDSWVSESSHISAVGSQCGELRVFQLQLGVNNVPVLAVPHKQGKSPG